MNRALAALTILCFSSLSSFAKSPVDLGFSAQTPYDRYMNPVKNVLGQLDGSSPSLDRIRHLVREGRSFRYSYTNPYVASAPSATASRRAGDCKDKALWLADQINDPSVRYVIGKARRNSSMSHAWLYWKDGENRWWILDCTNMREPVPADRVSSSQYIPLYSFAKNGTYRHGRTQTYAAESVAARRRSPVASNTR